MSDSEDVIVCRCEEVTAAQVKRAIADGAMDVQGIKRRTRAGMGLCQGRSCEVTIARMLSRELGVPLSTIRPDTPRPPIVSVTFEALAGAATDEEDG